jgi:ATP phosphoribosyltransferase
MQKLKIALAKGALLDGALEFLKTKGIEIDQDDLANKRKLEKRATHNLNFLNDYDIEFLFVRGHDVPIYVEHGAADLGIVGLDVILDSQVKVNQLKDLKYGDCDLAVCCIKDSYKSIEEIPNYTRVATSFPNLTKEFFAKKGIDVEVIKLYGSVELAPLTNLADLIVDLVATGKTLKENGLEPLADIMHCTSRLIANPVSYRYHKELCMHLID